MIDNIPVLPINANMTSAHPVNSSQRPGADSQKGVGADSLGMQASGVTAVDSQGAAGQDNSQTVNFTDILREIVQSMGTPSTPDARRSTLDALDNTPSTPGARRSTLDALDALMQQFLNGGAGAAGKIDAAKKTDSVSGSVDLLQQLLARLQVSLVQPGIVPVQTSSSGNGLSAMSDHLTNNAASPVLNSIDAAMTGLAAALAGIEQQNMAVANNTAIQMPNAADNATHNPGNPVSNDIFPAIRNDINAATQSVLTPNAANLTQSALTPNAANLTQSALTPNTANLTPNTERPMLNALTLNSGSLDQSGMNTLWFLDSKMSVVSPMQNSNNVEETDLSAAVPKISNNNSENSADTSALCAGVPLYKTSSAEDTKPAQEALPASRLNELSGPILKTLGSGDSNLVIKLSPPDMGTIQIKLKMENGVLTADFKVDSSAVKDMFTTAMPQIRQSIENSGIKTGNFFADLKEDSFTGGRRQQDQNQQQRQQREEKSSFFDYFA